MQMMCPRSDCGHIRNLDIAMAIVVVETSFETESKLKFSTGVCFTMI